MKKTLIGTIILGILASMAFCLFPTKGQVFCFYQNGKQYQLAEDQTLPGDTLDAARTGDVDQWLTINGKTAKVHGGKLYYLVPAETCAKQSQWTRLLGDRKSMEMPDEMGQAGIILGAGALLLVLVLGRVLVKLAVKI